MTGQPEQGVRPGRFVPADRTRRLALAVVAVTLAVGGAGVVTATTGDSVAATSAAGLAGPSLHAMNVAMVNAPAAPSPGGIEATSPVQPTAEVTPSEPASVAPTEQPTSTPTPTPTETESESQAASSAPSKTPSASASAEPTESPEASSAPRPATQPAVVNSEIPLGMVLIALLVLGIAVLAVRRISARSARGPDQPGSDLLDPGHTEDAHTTGWTTSVAGMVPFRAPEPLAPPVATGPPSSNATVMAFLMALGEAMIDSADPVTHVEAILKKVAAANGVPDAEIIVLPTALFISVPSSSTVDTVDTAAAAAGNEPLRLDQIDAVFDVVEDSQSGRIGPVEGLERIERARSMPPEFSPGTQMVGYVVMTLGLAMIMEASWTELAMAFVLGTGVGALAWWASRFSQPFQVLLPVAASFGVAASVFLVGRTGVDISSMSALIAPLVTFLPGALLTTGVIELATGQIVSGAGRLAAGGMRLVLIALGVLGGAQLVGVPASSAAEAASQPFGLLGPWLGVAIFGIGVVVHKCARRAALGWMLLVLYVAFAGQVIGGLLLGGTLSAFCGAVAMTPVAIFVASQRSGPTLLVGVLPAFWLLVPGAVALVGVTRVLGDEHTLGLSSLVNAGATMVTIALGIMLGLVLSSGLAAAADALPRSTSPEGSRQVR